MLGVDFLDHQSVSEPEAVVTGCSLPLIKDGPWVRRSASIGSSSLMLRSPSVVEPWCLSVPNVVDGVHIVILIIADVVHVVYDGVDRVPAVAVHVLEHAG